MSVFLISSIDEFVYQNNFSYDTSKIQMLDYYLLPLFVITIIVITMMIHFAYKNNAKENAYFLPAMFVKLFGAFFITMLYDYYYKGGDTTAYFNDGRLLLNLFLHDPKLGLEAFWISDIAEASRVTRMYLEYFRFSDSSETWLVAKFSAIVQIFTGQTFINTALIFGFVSFFPSWLLFKKFVSLVPKLTVQFAITFLFLPSVVVWGSGVMKDTITYGALAFLFVLLHDFFFCKKRSLWRILCIIINAYLIVSIKSYIMLAFILPFLLYVILETITSSKKVAMKKTLKPLTFILLIVFSFVGLFTFYDIVEKILISSFLEELITTQIYLSKGVVSGSAYDVGTIEPSFNGFLRVAPVSVQFVLFRPFLWESGNPIVILAALESLIFTIITICVLIKNYCFKVFSLIYKKPIILFCISFALLFAVPVGIASGNYGTLVRYKIPCIPFYLAGMFLLLQNDKKELHK